MAISYLLIYVLFSTFLALVQKENQVVPLGLLMVESFSWKNLSPGQLILKIHTYATKAAVISLPAGYVLVFFLCHSLKNRNIILNQIKGLFP